MRWALDEGAPTSDRGSASVLVALGCAVVLLIAVAGGVLASLFSLRQQVAAAADLAALAAAGVVLESQDIACERAAVVARANGGSVEACRLDGARAWVQVRAPTPQSLRWLVGDRRVMRARSSAELVPRRS